MRIVIADPALIDNSGHYLNYAVALKEELDRRGHETTVIGNLKVAPDLRAKHAILPGFSLGFYEMEVAGLRQLHPGGPSAGHKLVNSLINLSVPRRDWRRRLRAKVVRDILVRRTADDLRSIDSTMAFRHDDLVILNSVNALAAMGTARWLSGLPRARRPTVVLILHYAPIDDGAGHSSAQATWQGFFADSRAAGLSDHLRVCADSAGLVRSFARIADLPITQVPIPHLDPTPTGASKGPRGRPTVLFIGVATRIKGFHLLPGIIEAATEMMGPGKVSFCVQINVLDRSPEIGEAAAALRALDITRIEGPLERAAYYDVLAGADILLQPHDPGYYATQTSGVFADGRSAGLVEIVPARTTMAEEVVRDGGGVVVADGTVAAYVEGLRHCIEEFDRHAAAASAAARRWREANSPASFVDALNGVLPEDHRI